MNSAKSLRIRATVFAVLAALLYAVSIPFSKLLLEHAGSLMTAAFLYLGAGLGQLLNRGLRRLAGRPEQSERLSRRELPYTVGMVLLDIAAPILLMLGIARTDSANVSLLSNFEIVATSLAALLCFRERISKKLWSAIALVVLASALLSFEGAGAFVLNRGSLLVLGATVCWGFENNCTRMISNKSSTEIVAVKGCFSGLGSLLLALCAGERLPSPGILLLTMLLGFVSYGLSIDFYIRAQKELGAAKTSAYYALAPFMGVALSLLLLGERPEPSFYGALLLIAGSTVLIIRDNIELQHCHEHVHVHCHSHRHGSLVHCHEHSHLHEHLHVHGEGCGEHVHSEEELPLHEHTHGRSENPGESPETGGKS